MAAVVVVVVVVVVVAVARSSYNATTTTTANRIHHVISCCECATHTTPSPTLTSPTRLMLCIELRHPLTKPLRPQPPLRPLRRIVGRQRRGEDGQLVVAGAVAGEEGVEGQVEGVEVVVEVELERGVGGGGGGVVGGMVPLGCARSSGVLEVQGRPAETEQIGDGGGQGVMGDCACRGRAVGW